MPRHPPIAIANEFIKKGPGYLPAQMQLQKLVYIAHGWNLAINREPLVNEAPQAWDGGPVFRSIWDNIKTRGFDAATRLLKPWGSDEPAKAQLTVQEQAVIDHVWNKYGGFSGVALSEMTHQPNTPWTQTYFGRGRNAPIPDDLIHRHYVDLALAGRA